MKPFTCGLISSPISGTTMAAVLAQKNPEDSEIDDDVLYTGCPKKVLIIIDNKNENNNHTRN